MLAIQQPRKVLSQIPNRSQFGDRHPSELFTAVLPRLYIYQPSLVPFWVMEKTNQPKEGFICQDRTVLTQKIIQTIEDRKMPAISSSGANSPHAIIKD